MKNATLLISAAGALAASLAVPAQAADADRIKALEQVIQQLQQRLGELERKATVTAPPPPVAAAAATPAAVPVDTQLRLETLERSVNDMAVAASKPADTGVPLHGFVDVGWAKTSGNRPPDNGNGFRLGTFDLYLTPQLSDRVKALVELAVETDSNGGTAVDLERVQLGYTFSDALTVWGGRFHTPYGYWNTAYHHGAQIQTSVSRPRFLAFEDQGGILPAHSVGLWGNGRMRTTLGRVSYDLYVVNGNRVDNGVLNFNGGGDDNSQAGVGLNLGLSPQALPGLTVGVHAMQQRVGGVDSSGTTRGQARMQFFGGYSFLDTERWEVLAEYYNFHNTDLSGASSAHRSWAGYAQAGFHIDDRWTVYGRAERTVLNRLDPYFSLQSNGFSYRRQVAGARYELDPRSALKFEYDRMNDSANLLGLANTMRMQYAVRF